MRGLVFWFFLVAVTFFALHADGDDVLVMPGSPVSSVFFEFNPPVVVPSPAMATPDPTGSPDG